MIARPWSSTRRPCAGLRNGAVAALILLSAVLLPSEMVFANDTPRSPVAGVRPIPPRHAEIVGTLQILHEDREDGTSLHYRVLSADEGIRPGSSVEALTPRSMSRGAKSSLPHQNQRPKQRIEAASHPIRTLSLSRREG